MRIYNGGTPDEQVVATAQKLTVYDSVDRGRILDGVRVTANNISSVGADGPDERAVQASTWYDIYVIFNPTTSDIAGLLTEAVRTGTADADVANTLDDTGEDFTASPIIQVGDIVHNTTDNTWGQVGTVAPGSDNSQLSIVDEESNNLDLFPDGNETFKILRQPTLPSGYTFSRYVGSILTDGSSDFIIVKQINNHAVIANTVYGSPTDTSFAVRDLSSIVPPRAVKVQGTNKITRTTGTNTGIANISSTISGLAETWFFHEGVTSGSGRQLDTQFDMFIIEPQRIYSKVSAAGVTQTISISGWDVEF